MKDISDNPDIPWDWWGVSQNRNITMQYVLDNPRKRWNWYWLGRNPSITIKDILNNPDKHWDWDAVSQNPNLTLQDVVNNPDNLWSWNYISDNAFLYDETVRTRKLALAKSEMLQARSGCKLRAIQFHTNLCLNLVDMINH